MEPKFAGISFALFAVIFIVVGAENQCGDGKVASECVEGLLTAIMGDISEEEACVQMRTVLECLRNAADECLGEDRDPDVDKSLEELNNLISQNCPAPEVDADELDKCVDENKEYLLGCLTDSFSEVDRLLGRPDSVDMNVLKCQLYGVLSGCIVDRTGEKCGAAGRKKAIEEMKNMPSTMRDACAEQENADFFTSDLFTRKKR